MKKINRFLCIVLAGLLSFSIAGCGGASDFQKQQEKNGIVNFASSDAEFDTFINEYFMRHIREGELSIDTDPTRNIGSSVAYSKEWETRSLAWFDCSDKNFSSNRQNMLETYLNAFAGDKFGNMWHSTYDLAGGVTSPNDMFGQGWVFPNYTYRKQEMVGYEFNTGTGGWTGNVDTISAKNGFMKLKNSSPVARIETSSPDFSDGYFVDTNFSPFMEIDVRTADIEGYAEECSIEDIYFEWQTIEGGDSWYRVSQKEWSTTPTLVIPASFSTRMFLPMYLHKDWAGKKVKKLRVAIESKSNEPIDMVMEMNYVRCSFDTRQSNNSANYIAYLKEYTDFQANTAILKKNINKARMAMQFLLTHLKGETGLLDISYLAGHDGVSSPGHGIGNSYWDMLVAPPINIEANTYFYKAVKSMAALEQKMIDLNIDVAKPTVTNPQNNGVIQYTQTPETLSALLPIIQQKVTSELWSEEKGRFIHGTNTNGKIIDYGYIVFNLEAITEGLATPSQAEKILSWISGERIIEGETSTGEDIYKFEFAPRTSTIKNKGDYYWVNAKLFGNIAFGEQVQDGGAVMYTSYYDLMSRIKTRGADDAFARFKKIEEWYAKVKTAGGKGTEFYRDYYLLQGLQLQGGGTAGGIGLDVEFLESSLLYAAIPYGFFGINGAKANTLEFTPKLPSHLKFWRINNLRYNDIIFDAEMKDGKFTINIKSGNTDGKKLRVIVESDKKISTGKVNSTIEQSGKNKVVEMNFSNVTIKY